MPRRSFRGRGRRFKNVRRFIRRTVSSMGPLDVKRGAFDSVAVPARTSTAYDNPKEIPLIVAQESVDEEVEFNGTNPAEVRPYSKIVGLKTDFALTGLPTQQITRWLLYKAPDGEDLVSSLATANFHSSDDTPTMRELRANTLAKGWVVGSDRTAARLRIFVKRKTLRRLGSLRENDKLILVLANSGSTATTLEGIGSIYVRHN